MQLVEAGRAVRKQLDEYLVRGSRRRGFFGRAAVRALADEERLIRSIDAVDRVEDRDVKDGERARRDGRRRPVRADRVQRGAVPLGDDIRNGVARQSQSRGKNTDSEVVRVDSHGFLSAGSVRYTAGDL